MLAKLTEILKKMKLVPHTGYGEVTLTIKFFNGEITHIKEIYKENSIDVKKFK